MPSRPVRTRQSASFTFRRSAAVATLLLLALVLAACGGGTRSTTTKTATSTPSTTAPTTGRPSVSSGPVRETLTGGNHAPVVNKTWRYSLMVTDASGRPLSGTVDIEFVFGGVVVGRDRPPTHPVTNGRWHDTLEFPATAVGEPLTFRAVEAGLSPSI
ncbi:MAG: hypothetical protein ACXVXL_30210 [Solirubrobacteraceae bacterium]